MGRGYDRWCDEKEEDVCGWTRTDAENNILGQRWKSKFEVVFRAGIPIVLGSGNSAAPPESRPNVDGVPQVLEWDDFPIINVGACDAEGLHKWDGSQGQGTQKRGENEVGTQLTVFAVGEDVTCQTHVDGTSFQNSGTSFSGPAVAGVIAQHMVYQPWDRSKTGKDRVQAIKDFIRSDESSKVSSKNFLPGKDDEFRIVSTYGPHQSVLRTFTDFCVITDLEWCG